MSTGSRLGYGLFPTASLELGREGGSSGMAVCCVTSHNPHMLLLMHFRAELHVPLVSHTLWCLSHKLQGKPLKVADISEQAWTKFQCIFAWPCLIVLVILIVLIVSLPVIWKSHTTASHVPPDPPVYAPSGFLKYKNPPSHVLFFSLNINYDAILLHTLALKFTVTSQEYSLSNPEHYKASPNIFRTSEIFL